MMSLGKGCEEGVYSTRRATGILQKMLPGILLLSAVLPAAQAQLTVTLAAGADPPQPVGTPVTWTATASGADTTSALYRFSVSSPGGGTRIIQDYSPSSAFQWTTLQEGQYQIAVSVSAASMTASAASPYTFVSRVTGNAPVVSPTQHPLVALYSAPPCNAGQVRVLYQRVGSSIWQSTPPQTCQPGKSLNFYVAGLRGNENYVLQQQTNVNGADTPGPQLSFQSGIPSFAMPAASIVRPPDASSSPEPVLLTSLLPVDRVLSGAMATDLEGNLIWYLPLPSGNYLFRPIPGGTFFTINGDPILGQNFQEVDLAGNVVQQTHLLALNQQLAALGRADRLTNIAHDAIRLPNGHTVVMGYTERFLTDVQGPGTVDVLAELNLELDENFQITWTWSAFDFLDPSHAAVLGETCTAQMGCPLTLASIANDWTHGNSITWLPDGNLLYSLRSLDWVIKVDYKYGTGSGRVLWRLGPGGDFTLQSANQWDWFSHQHDVQFESGNYVIFDNGNTRLAQLGFGSSRGQVFAVDENARTATLVHSFDLGSYSIAFGSAQLLSNGNYHFQNGWINDQLLSQSVEFLPNGSPNYAISWQDTVYRSYRMKDLYTYGIGVDKFFVNQLFQDLLSRPADPDGFNYWLNGIENGTLSRGSIGATFLASTEFQAAGAYVYSAYIALLGRKPDFAGWQFWDTQLELGSTSQSGFVNALLGSFEYQQQFGSPDSTSFVTALYQNAFQRSPDSAGLAYWTSLLNANALTRADVASAFIASVEFAGRQNATNVDLLYFGLLRRDPDADGSAYWLSRINGGLSLADAFSLFTQTVEYLDRF